MLKKKMAPFLVVTALLVCFASATRLCRTTAAGEESAVATLLTYEAAHARLRRCPRWHIVDFSSQPHFFWVAREQRPAKELINVLVSVDWSHRPWADRRGVVRVESMHRRRKAKVDEDEYDTSYWRVVGDVHLEGDPVLVREVADYLREDLDP